LLASFIRFLVVGAVNTSASLVVILFAKEALKANTAGANAVGYVVGLMVSFALNGSWTFRFRSAGPGCLLRFFVAFGVSYLANLAVVFSLSKATECDSFWWQVAGAVVYSGLFYCGCRWYVFFENVRATRSGRA